MTLAELLATLPEQHREAVGNHFASAIETEKQIGISATKSKNNELLSAQGKLESLGYDKDKFETFDSFKDTISKTKQTASDSTITIASLNEKLNDEINMRQSYRYFS